jgi:hypothetical protein
MIDKKAIYIGIGVFALLVIYSSIRKKPSIDVGATEVQLKSVKETNTKSFSSIELPESLRPPIKLNNSESIPQTAKPRNLNSLVGISFMPRFDL